MKIFSVLNAEDVVKIKKIIKSGVWKNGKDSAEGAAKLIKENKQITADDKIFSELKPFLFKIHNDPTIKAYTYLKELIDPRVSLYELNDHYDWHIDVALLGNKRTDLSYTVFLSDKDEYEGGELAFKIGNQIFTVKGASGQIVIYPSGLLHKVNQIKSGNRLVLVGWINSHIKIEEHRDRLFQLAFEKNRLEKILGNDEIKTLTQIYEALIRDFSN
jgi:PKHD-type hydroxylase